MLRYGDSHAKRSHPRTRRDLPARQICRRLRSTAFAASHASNAALVPIERWEHAAKATETDLANVAFWGEEIGALGLDDTVMVAVYDDGRMTEAARVWFILQHFGCPAAIVNGGWPALSETAFPLAGEPPSDAGFVPRPGAGAVGLVDRAT